MKKGHFFLKFHCNFRRGSNGHSQQQNSGLEWEQRGGRGSGVQGEAGHFCELSELHKLLEQPLANEQNFEMAEPFGHQIVCDTSETKEQQQLHFKH